jgi:tetratricopeptide (TPR) repeat protein
MQLKSKDGYILTVIFFWFFLILTPLGVFNDWVSPEIHRGYYSVTQIDQGDDTGYYIFLRSLFFDGDIDFFNEKDYAHIDNITPTGFVFNNWQIGQSILFFPFFFFGHVLAIALKSFGLPISIDGYSTPYYLSTAIASHTYLFLGLLLLNKLIKHFTTERVALIVVVAIWVASPLLYYSFIRQRMAHTVEFFIAVVFIYSWIKKRESKDLVDHALLGALLGFFCLTRIINISFFALYFIDQILLLINNFPKEKRLLIKGFITRSTWMFLSFFLVLSPQLFVWQTLNGTPLPTRHFEMASSGLSFLISSDLFTKFLDVLFSPKWGLMFSFPIFFVSIIGFFSEKKFKHLKVGILAYLASMVFIVTVYPENSDSYGERHFISAIPLLALGLAGTLNWALRNNRRKYFLYSLIILFALWQYILLIEYKIYLVYNDPHYSITALEKIKTIVNLNPFDILRSSNIFRVLASPKPISWSYQDFLFLIGFPLTQLFFLVLSVFLIQSQAFRKSAKKLLTSRFQIKGFVFFTLILLSYFLITIEKLPYEEQKKRRDFQVKIAKTQRLIDDQDYSNAIKLGFQSNSIYPNHWLPHLLIGLSWEALGKPQKALKSYFEVIKINPRSFFALGHIGEIYIQQKKWNLANTFFTKAKAVNPTSSITYNYLGQTEVKSNNLDKAEEMFSTAIKLDNRFGDFYANLAIVYFIKTNHKKAMDQLIKAKQLGFENDTTKKLFDFYGIQSTKSNNQEKER